MRGGVAIMVAAMMLIASPRGLAQELDPPVADGELYTETPERMSAELALQEIERLELELEALDTIAPSALLISGIAAAILGAGGVAATGLLFGLDSNCSEGCAAPGVAGGAILLTGIALLSAGAATLPTVNYRRSRLQRRADDYRRFLPGGYSWMPLLWLGSNGGALGVRASF